MAVELENRLKAATDLGSSDLDAATAQLRDLVLSDAAADTEAIRVKEQAITQLCEFYIKQGNAQALADLLTSLRAFFNAIPKAKTAKLVRSIIDSIVKVPGSTALQVRPAQQHLAVPCGHVGVGSTGRVLAAPGSYTHLCIPCQLHGNMPVQVEVCKSQVEWARTEKRTFLRQRIELRLASLYLQVGAWQQQPNSGQRAALSQHGLPQPR